MTLKANWLPQSVQLTQSKNKNALFQHFCIAVGQELRISAFWILSLCEQKRRLIAFSENGKNTGQKDAWLVDDFSHPLAHVLRSESSMLLDDSKLVSWRQHTQFQQLIRARQKGDSVLIQALAGFSNKEPNKESNKADMILVLCGAPMLLARLLTDNEWQCFCQIVVNQYTLLETIQTPSSDRSLLPNSMMPIANVADEKATNHDINQRARQDAAKQQSADQTINALKDQLIGESELMCALREKVATVASSTLSVLIQGETGTGKELVARALHQLSDRRNHAMVAINCAAIPENLLESELFGYAKGAFSGANQDKKGLIAEAEGGTLFLDEIGDMPLMLQSKLLRVIETKTFRPLGGKHDVCVNFRLISATHVALKEYVEQGKFRLDLYFRLNQFPLAVPALNTRTEDLPQLIHHFIQRYNQTQYAQVEGISPTATHLLQQYDFSGNVRELKNLIDYACVLTPAGQSISAEHFDGRLVDSFCLPQLHAAYDLAGQEVRIDVGKIRNLKNTLRGFESDVIRQRLTTFGGDRALAAESLGLPKRTLAHKCLKWEIEKR